MSALDRLVPLPRLLEIDHVDLSVPPAPAWEVVRHGDLARSPLVRALFAIRTVPDRLRGRDGGPPRLRLDDMSSSPEQPGFRILIDDPPREVAVGAIGQVWKPAIPFRHAADPEAFAGFAEPGWIKVAWALRVAPRGDGSRVEIEVRVDATDEAAWREFRGYWRLIGPGSHLIRRSVLRGLAAELGAPEAVEDARRLPGDERLPDAAAQVSDRIQIAATPEAIWPWLVQMGRGRAGFYAIDALDNGGRRSAREVHTDLQAIAVGDVIPTGDGPDDGGGFEVLAVDPPRALVLGGLHDGDAGVRRPFAAARPARFWHVTWAFVLEPLDATTTCLHVRARAAFDPGQRLHATWIRPAHHLMQGAQLRHLAARAEGRLPRDDWRDVVEGTSGALLMALRLLAPFGRSRRAVWGLPAEAAARTYPGDERTAEPRWMWTHAVEIAAPAAAVWPWVAQIGADRAGFYSYQWLENLAGCEVQNAEVVHPEWQVKVGDGLRLHPALPPLEVVHVEPGRSFLAVGAADAAARASGRPWMTCTWLFDVEPLDAARCRFVSRYRVACSDDLVTRLQFGPTLVEPIGFVMDRRMLLGVKERAERSGRPAP
jgi:hypothetical protein